MKPFDLCHTPLKGVHLIEAGAGTGKTYTIAGLFLRLIVEHGLAIDQILVVTFTKAATEELKGRIRGRLLQAKAILANRMAPSEPLTDAMLDRGTDRGIALQRVQDALVGFDQAAIFTIHGYCQRLLQYFAFETGHLFEAELIEDAQALIQEAADDFWRRYVNRAPAELAHFVLNTLKGPEGFGGLFQHCRFPNLRLVPAADKPPLSAIGPWRRSSRSLQEAWPGARGTVTALLAAAGLNANSYGKCGPEGTETDDPETPRNRVVTALATAMDLWDGEYPLFNHFQKLTQSYIKQKTNKGHAVPTHPFFDRCEAALSCQETMESQLVAYLRYLKLKFIQQAAVLLDRKKQHDNLLVFDDLLLQVHGALVNDRSGYLADAVRRQYRAALVDEFQDTDPLQYDIFARLFGSGASLLFMIGDPKQAIYSFRGADIFSYLHAKVSTPGCHTLARNWRATPGLVKAVNTLFSSHPRPFAFERIPFETATAALPETNGGGPPFLLWYLTRTEQEDVVRPIAQQAASERIAAAVAQEVARLLSDPASGHAPSDIAVLTRTHRQAQMMKTALTRHRVPAVLHSAGQVFETPEAEVFLRVLGALAEPSDPRRVRTALATEMLGADAAMLGAAMDRDSEEWQARWSRFDHYHRIWLEHGFHRMFSRFMIAEGVKVRMLRLPDGERRLTNLLHLAEWVHQASVNHRLGPEGALKWLAAQCRRTTMDADAQTLRLESDAHAVRIITIHKSKGLEFEVVFCPFTWAGVKADDNAVVFHDPRHLDRPTLAIGPNIQPDHGRQAMEEELAENLRLLYVAVTRARRRCYLVWGCIRGSEVSAPAYLLHGVDDHSAQWMTTLQTRMKAMTDARMIADLTDLAHRSDNTIVVMPLPEPDLSVRYTQPYDPAVRLQGRRFERVIDHRWRVASFSSMTEDLPPESADEPDRDPDGPRISVDTDEPGGAETLFGFPRGTTAGLFFHDLLERHDFGVGDGPSRMALVTDVLDRHGFDRCWASAVDRMLEILGRAPLPDPSGGAPLRLAEIAPDQRVNEMEFYFPLKLTNAEQVRTVFAEHGGDLWTALPSNPLERLTFSPVHGFLKGFIDTVFSHEGRYFLVDWKSNHLGNAPSDYAPGRLQQVMAEAFYFLQYHLYVVALDQLLRLRVPGYSYERHFGGVYYLFLRGIQESGSGNGIYHAVPDGTLVRALRKVLLDERGGRKR